ncbi:hypothetical protein ACMATS_38170 (plasmid) [Streptoverticillium reticulum]|uniref:hypothetical protein n=1 Tax=Streptoverticillium reticulum TaxID=1433415 RepID=UPI0039BF0B37
MACGSEEVRFGRIVLETGKSAVEKSGGLDESGRGKYKQLHRENSGMERRVLRRSVVL